MDTEPSIIQHFRLELLQVPPAPLMKVGNSDPRSVRQGGPCARIVSTLRLVSRGAPRLLVLGGCISINGCRTIQLDSRYRYGKGVVQSGERTGFEKAKYFELGSTVNLDSKNLIVCRRPLASTTIALDIGLLSLLGRQCERSKGGPTQDSFLAPPVPLYYIKSCKI